MGKSAVSIDLTIEERRELQSLVRRRKTAHGRARRARIVLLAAHSHPDCRAAEEVAESIAEREIEPIAPSLADRAYLAAIEQFNDEFDRLIAKNRLK